MAEVDSCPRTQILKNSKILVNVEEALQDILVVTYAFETKLYQGVLLDSTKKELPCGITKPPGQGDDDRFFSVSQRFTYFQEKNSSFHIKKSVRPQSRMKNSRMTVRLRPRQVLCSKCRSICNENSENVDHSKQVKTVDKVPPCPSDRRLRSSGTSPRPLFSENHSDNQPVLIPKLSRLNPSEISNALSGNGKKRNISDDYWTKHNVESQDENSKENKDENFKENQDDNFKESNINKPITENSNVFNINKPITENNSVFNINKPITENSNVFSISMEQGSEQDEDSDTQDGTKRMVLRKKHSVGSMEDLWDESVFEDGMKKARNARTTPVIKISFGSPGEGTVLKIPSKVQDYIQSESEAEDIQKSKEAESRAAKKALKRAKKEARRRQLLASSSKMSPIRPLISGTSPPYDIMYRRRHKRKLKHKRKHKDERRHSRAGSEADEGTNSDNKLCWNILQPRDTYSAIKEQCLKQKLSINLKRLNANAYCLGSNGSKSPGSSSCSGSDFSDDPGESVPDFPPSHPLMLRLKSEPDMKSEAVDSCLTADGRQISVGDIVWGKIHGFPWWPGKILSIANHTNGNSSLEPQAHVAWYGSSTSSLMPCDQLCPFLEMFKTRFNKKKRGPYKEAIRQATLEATTAMQMNILS